MWAKKEGRSYSLAKMALELRPWHEGTLWQTQMKLQISVTAAHSTNTTACPERESRECLQSQGRGPHATHASVCSTRATVHSTQMRSECVLT